MYTISFEISAFTLSLLSFCYCLIVKHQQYQMPKGIRSFLASQHIWFLIMLLANLLSSASSVTGVWLSGLPSNETVAFWQYFFHACYFAFHATLSLAFGLYLVNVTGTDHTKHKVITSLFFVPYIAAEILIFTNSFTSWCFYMDAEHAYHRGILMPLLYGIGGFYVIVGSIIFLRNMRAISRRDGAAVGVFVLIAAAGIIVQAVRSDLLVELFFESIACLFMLMVLEEKAGHVDPSTGLLNRVAYADANRRLLMTKQSYAIVLVKVMELDQLTKHFSAVTADAFLRKIASYLRYNARGAEVYSYHREEFALIFKEGIADKAEAFANQTIERFKEEWTLDEIRIVFEAISAVVRVPEDVKEFKDLEDLMSLNYQKSRSGSYVVPMNEILEIMDMRNCEEALRKAVNQKKLFLKYQPIWSIAEKRSVSAEALLRVDMPELEDLSPEVYVPIAEKTGLIHEIGLFVFEEVCKFLAKERFQKTSIRYVELNLSFYQLTYANLVEKFEEIRSRYGVPSNKINLEITETANAADRLEVLNTVERFRELGYTFSLDDFGTGYSNFVRMIKSKFENIKIDKSILWDLTEKQKDVDVLKSLMLFIKNQGSSIVQEGVETEEQLKLVEECGCDYVQGFYFSKPISEDEFFLYLEKEESNRK